MTGRGRRPFRAPSSGVAALGEGLFVLIGTRAPCPCENVSCQVPYRMTTRDDDGLAAGLVRVLDAAGRTVGTFATRQDAVDAFGHRHLIPANESWSR